MLKNNPDQLKIDFNQFDPDPIKAGSPLKELIELLGTTEDDIDTLANNGSYRKALIDRGASEEQVDAVYRVSPESNETSSETADEVRTIDSGASVSIREVRAPNLLYGAKNLAEASSKEGLIYAIETDHPSVRGKFDRSDIPRLSLKAERCSNIGKNALRNAYGDPGALIKAGFNRSDVELDMKDNENEFDSTYIGPDTEKKKNLVKLRKIQKRHLK